MNEGCVTTVMTGVAGVDHWFRGCCGTALGADSCQEVHEDLLGAKMDTVG